MAGLAERLHTATVLLCTVASLLLLGCGATTNVRRAVEEASQHDRVALAVGLYPYVPRPAQLERAIEAAWQAKHPKVVLRFKSWDGGYDADPFGMDVFVFDALFLGSFIQKGLLAGLRPDEVVGLEDYLPYAIGGAKQGDLYYGLPMFGCANMLFYRASDKAVAAAATLTALKQAVGECSYTSDVPPDTRGLLVDLKGRTTNATMYADILESINGAWPLSLPTDPSQLDSKAIAAQKTLLAMASYYNATRDPKAGAYGRAESFSAGNGRALMGFTESMSAMTAETRAQLEFRPFPLGDNAGARPLFFADLVGISRSTSQRELALDLATLMTSTAVLVEGMRSTDSEPPQFLMPVRMSVFLQLAGEEALYQRMRELVVEARPILFDLGPDVRAFITNTTSAIKHRTRADYPCGCDQDGGAIATQKQANATCPAVCKDHGGWNGKWTSYPPDGPSTWKSGCGCRVCAVD